MIAFSLPYLNVITFLCSVFYQWNFLADYYVEKSAYILLFFRRCLSFFKDTILRISSSSSSYRVNILLKLWETSLKKQCNGSIYWIAFASYSIFCLFELKFRIYEIIMLVHFKEGEDEEIKPLEAITGSTLTSFLLL